MRGRIWLSLFLALLLVCLFVLISHSRAFIQLFFEHSGIAITQNEIANAHNKKTPDLRPQLIPKIIHQVFHEWGNKSMPADWEELRQTCINTNCDWEYMLWTEESSREFIKAHFPWFIDTYNGYRYPVQRVDSVRYFLMLHYGGIYLDLDNQIRPLGLSLRLYPLLYYPTWTTDGGRGALSNDILASLPNHPFWKLLTDSLIPYNYDFIFPYITISYASGQWFETAIWQAYHAALPQVSAGGSENRLYRIMMDDRPGTEPWIFFSQERGGSWKNWDNVLFLWIGDHLVVLALCVCGLVGLIWWAGMRCLRCRGVIRHMKGYVPLVEGQKKDDDM